MASSPDMPRGKCLSPLLALDEGGEERPLAQKEAMSNQMTDILLGRVHELNATFEKFKRTLHSDVDASTDTSTAQLFQERSAMVQAKARVAVQEIPPTLKLPGLLSSRPGGMKPSRVYTAKHLFRPDRSGQQNTNNFTSHHPSVATGRGADTSSVASGMPDTSRKEVTRSSSTLHGINAPAFNMDDSRERILQERELHCIADRHVTRSIEKVTYTYGSEPFDCQPDLMLGYVRTHIHLPQNENINMSFARMTRCTLVHKIMTKIFWYCVCLYIIIHKNQTLLEHERIAATRRRLESEIVSATDSAKYLRRDLSGLYIELMRVLQHRVATIKRDLVHLYIPFALGKAILTAFRYLCPGSRHLYNDLLQERVYETCCELLLGAQLSSVSIRATRARLFEDESRKSAPADLSSVATSNQDEESIEDPSLLTVDNEESTHSEQLNEGSVTRHEGPEDSLDEELYRTTLQPRERYDATLVGTLLGEFLVEKSGKNKSTLRPGNSAPHLVYRTLPNSNARVGGTWTFRKSQPRTQTKVLNEKYLQRREEFDSFMQKSKATLACHIRSVTKSQDDVLRGGMEGVGRFCMDLAHSKSGHRLRASDGSISGESKGTRNTHLQGEKRLDWYANLAVQAHLPPAERVIAARDKIEASKMREQQKARTHARIMLLP